MRKKNLSILLFLTFLIFTGINLFGDERKENIELFLIVDKSKSMVEEISDVTDYINSSFIDKFLIDGDKLVIIQFYGEAEVIFDGYINNNNKNNVLSMVSGMEADGRFTDIGNALDRLKKSLADEEKYNRRYLILLTDGKQEAPPESPYYAVDGSFNHEFLEHTKEIRKKGWKILILGVGVDTAVEELAEELGATHETINFEDASPPPKKEDEILGRILASDFVIGDSQIAFELESAGYSLQRKIIIDQITYQTETGSYSLIKENEEITIQPEERLKIEIPFDKTLLSNFTDSDNSGTVFFSFSGDTAFMPSVLENVIIRGTGSIENKENSVKTEKSGVNWLIIVIVIVAAAAVVAFFIIRNVIFHRENDERKNIQDEISGNS